MIRVLQLDHSLLRASIHLFPEAGPLSWVFLPRAKHYYGILLEVTLDPARSWTRIYCLKPCVANPVGGAKFRRVVIQSGRPLRLECRSSGEAVGRKNRLDPSWW